MKEISGQEGGDTGSSMVFCTTAPTTVRNILTRVKSNEDGAASNKPSFHICYRSHHRLKVDILMPAKGLDCRLSIRTCKETILIFKWKPGSISLDKKSFQSRLDPRAPLFVREWGRGEVWGPLGKSVLSWTTAKSVFNWFIHVRVGTEHPTRFTCEREGREVLVGNSPLLV